MRSLRTATLFIALFTLLALPVAGYALDKGTARLTAVTPLDGGCVSGPTGGTTEAWDIQPGFTYRITFEDVSECANGGTDATLDIRVNSSIPGYEYTDIVATNVAPGVYEFDFTLPETAWCTLPLLYCTTPGEWLTTGLFVTRHDGGTNNNGVPYAAHLRASNFGAGCSNPEMMMGPECGAVPVNSSTWSSMKAKFE